MKEVPVPRKIFSAVFLLLLVLMATEVGPVMVAEAKKCVGPSDSFGDDNPCYSDEDAAKCEKACRNDGYEPGYCSEGGLCICIGECPT